MEIQLLTAPGWGKCLAAKSLVLAVIESMRAERPDLVLEVVDITEHPEVAVKYRVMSTPALVINGRLALTGVPREADLRRAILGK